MTEFLGGNGGNKFGSFVIKVITIVILMLAAFFIGATRDWMTVTKEGAVSTSRIEQVERNFNAHLIWAEREKQEYVRKDVMSPQLADMSRRLERIEQLLMEKKAK